MLVQQRQQASRDNRRAYVGRALFSFGVRPFFLGASLWATFAVALWIVSLALGHADIGGRPGLDWHMDEMLFGFLPAVFAGFLLTAIPNWTGRLPVTGTSLALLFGLWAGGRFAGTVAGDVGLAATVLDLSFLFVFAGLIWREILTARYRRNLPVCMVVTAFALSHLLFHLREVFPAIGDIGIRAGLSAAAGMIALIGGRIVPSFTLNWLTAQGRPAAAPASVAALDRTAPALLGLALAGWVASPSSAIAGVALIASGLMTLMRLSRWHTMSTAGEALVWILHVGYAWLGLALLTLGVSILVPGYVPPSAGIHALTAGAIGVMVLAVMTRATLGHTGCRLSADTATVAIYLLINLAAILRVAAPFFANAQIPLLTASAIAWILAFGMFAFCYGPRLVASRRGA